MHQFFTVVLLLEIFTQKALAFKGMDVSTAVSVSAWECLKREGYQFAIVRVYRSLGSVDPNGANTIKNARAAGIKYVDGYIFPCFECGNPKNQVKTTMDHLNQNGAQIGQLWLDVEGTQYWSSNHNDNVKFIGDMIEEAKNENVVVAMYTSASQWKPITGNSNKYGDLQLWYAHYDKNPSFSDFKPFGGWEKATMKQYEGDTTACGVGIDKNWYP